MRPQGTSIVMKGVTIILFLAIIASYSYGSLLSNFDPEKLNIKVKKAGGTAGIVGESVQLVKDHFIRRNVLDPQQWKQIIHDSHTMNNTIEVMKTLIDKLEDPYSRYFGKPGMLLRSSKFRGVSVSTGIGVARTLRLSNIGRNLRRSILSTNTSMSTFAKVKLVAPILVSAIACMRAVQHVMQQDQRMAMVPASISVGCACSFLYQNAVSFEVTSVDNSTLTSDGMNCNIGKGDQLLAINGRKVLGLSLHMINKLLHDGECGGTVAVTLGRSGLDPPLRPAVQKPHITATPMRLLQLWNPLRRVKAVSARQGCNPLAAGPLSSPLSTAWREVQVNVTRQYVPAPSTLISQLLPSCGCGVGYISIGEFSDQTLHDVCDAIDDLKTRQSTAHNSSLSALVFDLRGNPGGPIVPALDIAASFLSKGAVLTQLASHGRTLKYHSTNRQPDLTTALLLLVDERTASASEILVEALCDNVRATSMGCRTVGKNVAQAVLSLSDGSGLCFTVREYFSPSGRFMGNGHSPGIPVQGPVDISRLRYNASSFVWTH